MGQVVFRENRTGIAEMMAAPFMVKAMEDRAAKGMARAISIAPVLTGQYKASFVLRSGLKDGKAWAAYGNTARSKQGFAYPVIVEFGSRTGSPRQRILGRSIDAMRF